MSRTASLLLLPLLACAGRDTVGSTPEAAVDSLLAADRDFAARAANTTLIPGLTAMMASDVVVPAPGGRFVRGRDSLAALLATNPDNAGARIEWSPIRAGVSADGTQGFTLGFMEVRNPDSTVIPMKYLAYWERGAEGWRVRVYKRRQRPPGDVARTLVPPAIPARLVAVNGDSTTVSRFAVDLAATERAFSDEARRIGLGPAFEAYGSPDAMHLGSSNDTGFVVGAEAIAAGVAQGDTGRATISWSSEQVIVASSGDLGVSVGFIVPDPDSTGVPPPRFPFFTVWRRDSTSLPWRYIAE
jgi:ketosteroid isomerase-like protein